MKDNLKIQRTKKAIRAAVIDLIAQKSLAKLSISDITRVAKINRGTFYLHFIDKQDLIDQYEQTLIDHVAAIFDQATPLLPSSQANLNQVITKILTYIDQERSLFQALLGENGDPTFVGKIKRMFKHYLHASIVATDEKYQPKIPIKYTEELALDSLLGIVTVWVMDPQPDSIPAVAQILSTTRFMAPVTLLGIDDPN